MFQTGDDVSAAIHNGDAAIHNVPHAVMQEDQGGVHGRDAQPVDYQEDDAAAAGADPEDAHAAKRLKVAEKYRDLSVRCETKARLKERIIGKELDRLQRCVTAVPPITPALTIDRDIAAFNNGELVKGIMVDACNPRTGLWVRGVISQLGSASRCQRGARAAAAPGDELGKHVLVIVTLPGGGGERAYRVECLRRVQPAGE